MFGVRTLSALFGFVPPGPYASGPAGNRSPAPRVYEAQDRNEDRPDLHHAAPEPL
jgi:hypothetical protein